jgi:transcriptional regulator with XRE-family HTH domain
VDAGEKLKEIRNRLGLSTRDVAMRSQRIADQEKNTEFLISSAWLTQVENEKGALPSIYKIFTLASVYGWAYDQLLFLYGVDIQQTAVYHSEMPGDKTHPIEFRRPDGLKPVELPSAVIAALDLNQTSLLPQMLGPWADIPAALLRDFDWRYRRYGFIGLKDRTMYPIIRPGSFVSIDPHVTKPKQVLVQNEHERPVYFLDLRKEYACGWCDHVEGKLLLVPHPLANLQTRIFAFPSEADIIGQVIGVAMRIVLDPR